MASNLISLCHDCHPWVHAHPALSRAADAGWIVSRYADPAATPVRSLPHGGGLYLLDDEYSWPQAA